MAKYHVSICFEKYRFENKYPIRGCNLITGPALVDMVLYRSYQVKLKRQAIVYSKTY